MQIPASLAWQRWLFETLYSNRYLYRFASTIPFAGQWRTWQRLILADLYGCDVLELGCGLGDLLADMIEAGYNCRAIENSQEMVDAARSTLRERSLGEPFWIIQGQAQRLLFANASFDTVVSTFPNEYIYDPETLAEVERVLRSIEVELDSFRSITHNESCLIVEQKVQVTTVCNVFEQNNYCIYKVITYLLRA
ncbi:class I SAM-dependent methyltransferase [Gloeocapsa sp. BRSZ]